MKTGILVVVDLPQVSIDLVYADGAAADLLVPVVPGERRRGHGEWRIDGLTDLRIVD